MIEKSILDVIVNSIGAVAVTVLFLIYLDRNEKRTYCLIQNHLAHLSDVLSKTSDTLSGLTQIIGGLEKLIIASLAKNDKNNKIRGGE